MTISPTTQDFGELSRDQTVRAVFHITNPHTVQVSLGSISKGCSCSDASFAAEVIPPGSSTELTVTWNLRGKRGRTFESVSFPFSGPNGISGFLQARVSATVHGVVDPDLDVLERSRANREGTVTYRSRIGRTFQITNAETNHGSIVAKVLSGGQSVRVVFDPSVSGWESGQLWLTALTDLPDEPQINVWVRVSDPPQGKK